MRWPARLFPGSLHYHGTLVGADVLSVCSVGCRQCRGVRSPRLPHCHVVVTEVRYHMKEKYGDRLGVVELDTTTPAGNAAWSAALQAGLAPGRPLHRRVSPRSSSVTQLSLAR